MALARPQFGFKWEEMKRHGIEILFAVDTSKSMLSTDVKPDRLTRAKLAVDDFVAKLNGDGVGLVAFAGNAFLQCPITLDYGAFGESLAALDVNTIPRGGTDITSAIREAQVALANRTGKDKILILLTDGENLEGNAIDAAKAAAKDGLKIYTVGVGTANGDLIPLPAENGGGVVKDDSGKPVKSQLDETTLKAIAEATGGIYAPLGAQGQGLETIYQSGLAPLAKHELASRQQKVYIERFQWPLAAALAFLLASLMVGNRRQPARKKVTVTAPAPAFSKRGLQTATAVLAGMLVSGFSAQASTTDALKAFQKGDYQTAQKEYAAAAQKSPEKSVLHYDAGTAAYKAGQFDQAAESFQKALGTQAAKDPKQIAAQEDSLYNLGNTLYRTGQGTEKTKPEDTIKTWEQAVKTYDEALKLHANDVDAKFNRDLVQKKIDELKKQQQQQKDQQKQDQKDDKKDQKQDQKQDQKNDDQKKDEQKNQDQSGQGSNDKNEQKKQPDQGKNDQKDQKDSSGQNSPQDKPDDKGQQKPGSKGDDKNKPEEQKGNQPDQKPGDQNQAKQDKKDGQGDKPDQQQQQAQNQPGQNSAGGKPGTAQDQQASGGQPEPRVPGQMSKDEAKQLLDSLKDEQKNLPSAPLARGGGNPQSEQTIKDW